jgi:hypothetical protein
VGACQEGAQRDLADAGPILPLQVALQHLEPPCHGKKQPSALCVGWVLCVWGRGMGGVSNCRERVSEPVCVADDEESVKNQGSINQSPMHNRATKTYTDTYPRRMHMKTKKKGAAGLDF